MHCDLFNSRAFRLTRKKYYYLENVPREVGNIPFNKGRGVTLDA